MRIVFFGASKLGYECCKAIIEAGHTVSGIFTIPETFSIKYKEEAERRNVKNVLFRDFKDFNLKYNIPVIEAEGNLSRYQEDLIKFNPEFILVIGWYYLIPAAMMQMAPKGVAGIHGSLLPKYRGNAPFVWAMINGEKETGISFFFFDDGIETGDIITQRTIPIEDKDTIKEILDKAEAASIEALLESLPKIADGTAKRTKQQHKLATFFPKRAPEDGLIDWSWDAKRIRDFVRAQTKPYPGAYTIINGKKVVIWDADISDTGSL
jgi:methionyl-tRNA formyltransferase